METPCRVFRNLSQMGNGKINSGNLIPTVSRQVLMSPVVEYTSMFRINTCYCSNNLPLKSAQ